MCTQHYTGKLACVVLLFGSIFAIPNVPSRERQEVEDIFVPYTEQRHDGFDWQLCKALESPNLGNVIFSPISVKLLLAMLKEGSAGATEKELEAVLEITNGSEYKYSNILHTLKKISPHYVLDIGTKMYVDSGVFVQQKYAARLESLYDTEIGHLNFRDKADEARDEINHWVKNITHDRIQHLVGSEDLRDALLLMVNALYFKGQWLYQFPRNQTTMGGFYVNPKQTVTVQYMINYGRYYYAESSDLDAKILRLPFKGNHFSMFIVLPNSKAGLSRLIKDISPSTIRVLQTEMADPSYIHVILPKFKFDFTAKLERILQKLGVRQMFQHTASLPKISRGKGNTRSMMVTDVIQKAGIEINEEGSTVYAATDIVLVNKFGNADNIFNASSPFLMFIEDVRTGTLLFVGKVENPVQLEQLPFPDEYATGDRYGSRPAPQPAVLATNASSSSPSFSLDPEGEELENYEHKRFNFFDVEFLQVICRQAQDQNVLISPTSIKIILTMLLEGAAGATADELKTALRLPSESERVRSHLKDIIDKLYVRTNSVNFKMANRVYINNQLAPNTQFLQKLQNYYKADIESLSFQSPQVAANKINEWVNYLTQGYIPALISPGALRTDTSALVMNALYFKGIWTEAFDERQTRPVCFYLLSGECKKVNMMEMSSVLNYAAVDDLDAQAVNLEYQDNTYSMLILVPNKKTGINQLLRDISYVPVHKIVERLSRTEIIMSMPRFQIDYTADVVPNLQSLHINTLFTPNANLTKMIEGNTPVYVNNIIHKAKIQVNEKGTIAAAASAAVVVPLMGTTKPRVKADHPFLFFIRHVETGTVLFAGRLNNPEDAPQEEPARAGGRYVETQQKETVRNYDSFNPQSQASAQRPYHAYNSPVNKNVPQTRKTPQNDAITF